MPPPDPEVPAPSPTAYAEATELRAFISNVEIPEDGKPVVDWQLTDGDGVAILDLGPRDVRFSMAKLQASPLGNLTGTWQSYINRIRDPDPDEGPGTEPRLQATYEREAGEFTNNNDGTYRYKFDLSVTDLPEEILEQASTEGLDLSYEPDRTHRMVMQFSNSEGWANPIYDWVPATGETDNVFNMDIAATENCNSCHDPLRYHGSGRREVEYCVVCHNPGSTEPSTTNTVDMKVMIHKIHMGAELPSVQAGGSYIIDGNDYSGLVYPQDIRNCENCHAGTRTGAGRDDLTLTAQGDNWAEYSTRATCGSCHDLLDFDSHAGGQPDDSNCASCHSVGGEAGSIEQSHVIFEQEAMAAYTTEILSVTDTGPGEFPVVNLRVFNPLTGDDYDIFNDPVWTQSRSRLRVQLAWSTTDITNTGNQREDANAVRLDVLGDGEINGDGSYRVASEVAIPDGSLSPGVAATGSGVAVTEGRARLPDPDDPEDQVSVPVDNFHTFFSIDEPDGQPTPRRDIASIEKCQACHVSVAFHGGSRNNNINNCVTCHNPRNTDRDERADLDEPPADGLAEQSIHFKVMIHGIHAAGVREVPYQVGAEVYDDSHVRYPGEISNCASCHDGDTYTLPLPSVALGTTLGTGEDLEDPADDVVATPATATCSNCHDDRVAKSHMETNGGSFSTTQRAIDDGEVVEQCELCHGSGKVADVSIVHGVR